LSEYIKVVGYGTALFIGDVVTQVTAGGLEILTTPGTTVPTGVNANYGAASTATTHYVYSDPFTIFEGQDDGDTDGFALADMGSNANVVTGTGNSVTKISGHEIDEGTINTTNSLDLHIRRLFPYPGNNYGESNGDFEVCFNSHRAHGLTVGLA
jgi:hypothetical protein